MGGRSHTKVVALAALAMGCPAPTGSERLEGRWVGVRAEGTSEDTSPAANAFATATEFDFHRDTLTVTTAMATQSGRYRVVTEDPTRVVIATDRDGPELTQTFTLTSDTTMRWAVLDGKSIVLARQ
jgi:hypothetical protein